MIKATIKATIKETKRIAHKLHGMGVNITAIAGDGKAPRYQWKQDVDTQQDAPRLRQLPWDGYTTKDGTVVPPAGRVGVMHSNSIGHWRCFDVDALKDVDGAKKPVDAGIPLTLLAYLGLPDDYEWAMRSGSGAGWHIYVQCNGTLPEGALTENPGEKGAYTGAPRNPGDFDHIELRWHGVQSVPSFASVDNVPDNPPALVDVERVVEAFKAVTPPPQATTQPVLPNKPVHKPAQATDDTIAMVKQQLDLVEVANKLYGNGTRDGHEIRYPNNGGLLVNADKQQWYCHLSEQGGDVLDLLCYHKYGSVLNGDKERFRVVLREAAAMAGVELPARASARRHNGNGTHKDGGGGGGTDTEMALFKEDIEAISFDPEKFAFNEVSQALEYEGKAFSEGLRHEIIWGLRCRGYGRRGNDPTRQIGAIEPALQTLARQRPYHPIRQYIEALPEWDGQDHIARLAGHFTCDNNDVIYADGSQRSLFHALLRRWLVGAVAKAYGIHQVMTLVICGPQGIGKSYLASWLASQVPGYFREGGISPDNKDHKIAQCATWIWEIAELGATTRKADVEALKAFLTTRDHTERHPYARIPTNQPTLACFFGTLNNGEFLNDETGNRRFWTTTISQVDKAYSSTLNVNAIWSQAMALWRAGEGLGLSEEERAVVDAGNKERYQAEHGFEGYISRFFSPDSDSLMGISDIADHINQRLGRVAVTPQDIRRGTLKRSLVSVGYAAPDRKTRHNGRRDRWWCIRALDDPAPDPAPDPDPAQPGPTRPNRVGPPAYAIEKPHSATRPNRPNHSGKKTFTGEEHTHTVVQTDSEIKYSENVGPVGPPEENDLDFMHQEAGRGVAQPSPGLGQGWATSGGETAQKRNALLERLTALTDTEPAAWKANSDDELELLIATIETEEADVASVAALLGDDGVPRGWRWEPTRPHQLVSERDRTSMDVDKGRVVAEAISRSLGWRIERAQAAYEAYEAFGQEAV